MAMTQKQKIALLEKFDRTQKQRTQDFKFAGKFEGKTGQKVYNQHLKNRSMTTRMLTELKRLQGSR